MTTQPSPSHGVTDDTLAHAAAEAAHALTNGWDDEHAQQPTPEELADLFLALEDTHPGVRVELVCSVCHGTGVISIDQFGNKDRCEPCEQRDEGAAA